MYGDAVVWGGGVVGLFLFAFIYLSFFKLNLYIKQNDYTMKYALQYIIKS